MDKKNHSFSLFTSHWLKSLCHPTEYLTLMKCFTSKSSYTILRRKYDASILQGRVNSNLTFCWFVGCALGGTAFSKCQNQSQIKWKQNKKKAYITNSVIRQIVFERKDTFLITVFSNFLLKTSYWLFISEHFESIFVDALH